MIDIILSISQIYILHL